MTHVDRAWQYARDVVSGEVLAPELVRLQCQRSLDWLEEGRYFFDEETAEYACTFMSALPHTKGQWLGQKLHLENWQCFFIAMVFGWLKEDGLRVIQKVRLYVPRKNGKSDLAARIALYMLVADDEEAPEVFCGATTQNQAMEVFRPAHRMATSRAAWEFREAFPIEVRAQSIIELATRGFFQPVVGDPGDGASPSCAITDEYHEHKTDSQLSTMETGMGARRQPLSFVPSTAGETIGGPCQLDWLDCASVLRGFTEDDTLFPLIYSADPDDDWTSEEALIKANPNYDVSVKAEFLKQRQKEAIASARKQGPFKTKHLNIWVGAMDAYFNMEDWAACAADIELEDFSDCDAWIGVDLASKKDIASVGVVIDAPDGKIAKFSYNFAPEEGDFGSNEERYQGFTEEGYLIRTPGNVIDFEFIEEAILDIARRINLRGLGADEFQGNYLMSRLQALGIDVRVYGMTVKNFSDPMKSFDADIVARRIIHPGNKCLDWQMANVVAKEDAKENVFPRKARRENKIDGPVALLIADGLRMADLTEGEKRSKSYLHTHSMVVLD